VRRTVLLSASVMLVVPLVSGVAFAAILNCVAGEDSCVRTKKDDTYNGSEKIDNPYVFRHAILKLLLTEILCLFSMTALLGRGKVLALAK
jgi:hypothetical protein